VSELRVNNVSEVGGDAVIASGVLDSGSLPTGSVLQVVSTTKTNTFAATIAPGGNALVTGLSATITPTSSSSKILVLTSVNGAYSASGVEGSLSIAIDRGGTLVGVGDAAGSRNRVSGANRVFSSDTQNIVNVSSSVLDTPSTTSATTYQIRVYNSYTSATPIVRVNSNQADTDVNQTARTASTITLMEIAG